MTKIKRNSSPQKGNQINKGEAKVKGVNSGNRFNLLGVLQYALFSVLVKLLLFIGGRFMTLNAIDELKNSLNMNRQKGWMKKYKRNSLFRHLRNHLAKTVSIPLNLTQLAEGIKKSGSLFSTKRVDKNDYNKLLIIMMSMPSPENVITGIIGRIKVANRAIRAKEIVDACAVSTWVTIPGADILLYRDHIEAFENTKKSEKTAAWKIVMNDLKALLSVFQLAATADNPNSIVILESGKFKIKGVGNKSRQVFGLTNGINGTINLVGNTTRGRCLHDWWISFDNGETWTRMPPTLDSLTQMKGLKIGSNVGFRHQLIVAKGDNGKLETLFITVT